MANVFATLKTWLGIGNPKCLVRTYTFGAAFTYTTGGEPISLVELGLTNWPIYMLIESVGGYMFSWDYTNHKLMAWFADYDGGADGPLIEETSSGTGLQNAVVRLVYWGW
jgi:hypothetical protein